MAKGLNFRLGASNAARPAMRGFKRDLDNIRGSMGRTQPLQRSWNRGLNANRRAVQQLGFQVTDFATQVAGGQSAMLAFTQQGGQMLQFFGPFGAIMAAFLAIFGSMFIALSRSGKALSDLTPIVGVLQNEFVAIGRVLSAVKELMIDFANVVGYGEYIKTITDCSLHEIVPDQEGSYVTLGYQVGKFLPLVTVATAEATPFTGTLTDSVGLVPNPAVTQDSISLGVRYDVNDYSALKFEYKTVDPDVAAVQVDWTGSGGPAMAIPFNAGFLMGGDPTLDDYEVVSVTYDMIF